MSGSPPLNNVEAAYVASTVDFRKYFHFAKRLVWANRISIGGSKSLDNDKIQQRYLLGGTDLWLNSIPNRENFREEFENLLFSNRVVPFRGWVAYDLTGSKFGVVNSELRFPFIREISLVAPFPISIRYILGALFVDIGNAWDPQDQIQSLPLPDKIYGGMGFGFRANLGGFVIRWDRAWKTDWRTYLKSPVNYLSLGADF